MEILAFVALGFSWALAPGAFILVLSSRIEGWVRVSAGLLTLGLGVSIYLFSRVVESECLGGDYCGGFDNTVVYVTAVAFIALLALELFVAARALHRRRALRAAANP